MKTIKLTDEYIKDLKKRYKANYNVKVKELIRLDLLKKMLDKMPDCAGY